MKEEKRKRKRKNKHGAHTRKRINRQRAIFDACADAYIDALADAALNQIIEALLLSSDGRAFLCCYLPGIKEAVEIEFRLDELINHCGGDIAEVVGACSIH